MNNFLSIVWYRVLPAEYGGQKGIAHFNDHLGNRVPLTCLCPRNNISDHQTSYKVDNSLPVSKLQFWNPFVRKKILTLIRKQKFTHVIIEHPWHGWLGKHKNNAGFIFIVHAHNIEYLRIKAKKKPWWPFLRKLEHSAFGFADHILFKTEEDKETAIKSFHVSRDRCSVVPYGTVLNVSPSRDDQLRAEVRRELSLAPDERLILFSGSLNYEPNVSAINAITDHIIPLLQKKNFFFRVIICGHLDKKKITILNQGLTAIGFVPGLERILRSADVFINPVTIGSGIQTKNIEALANGCNVVATAFAAKGLPGYLLNKKLFIAADNDWTSFTNHIIAASATDQPTPQQFYDDYNWQNIIDRLLAQIG